MTKQTIKNPYSIKNLFSLKKDFKPNTFKVMNFKQTLHIILILLVGWSCKSPQGPLYPSYRNLGSLRDIFNEIPVEQKSLFFYFPVYSQIYKENLTGELILQEKTNVETEENQKIRVSKLTFNLRIISKNRNEHIRIREYRGNVYYNGDMLDLHSKDCYTYAKKNYSDRFYIIEGWDCDHMIFLLKKQGNFVFINNYSPLFKSLNEENQARILYTNWFISDEIFIHTELIKKKWYGKYLDTTEEYYIFYGKEAEKYIQPKKGARLFPGNTTIPISFVMGDFIFVSKETKIQVSDKLFIY